MSEFSNGKIYTIRSKSNITSIYVGCTIQTLEKRFYQHQILSAKSETTFYKTFQENMDDWYIELYELFPCKNYRELYIREGQIIKEIGTLNSEVLEKSERKPRPEKEIVKRPSSKQWSINHKSDVLDYHKQYNEKNKLRIQEIGQQRMICECGCELRKDQLPRHRRSNKHNNLIKNIL